LFSPEQPIDHPAADTLSQYNDDAKLLISKSYTDLTRVLDTMLTKYKKGNNPKPSAMGSGQVLT
ncbi:MAG: hypothetical protein LBT13_06990, partial [Treponema sp.]|nr:hypothetical protein [Treponema sp.]